MKIIRRSFGERFALLELDNGDYYHLDLDSKYIPSAGDELAFEHFDEGRAVYSISHPISGESGYLQFNLEMYYLKTDSHTLKEL